MEYLTTDNLQTSGLALALLYTIRVIYQMSKDATKVMTNHLEHNTKSNIILVETMQHLSKLLKNKLK